MNRKDDHLNYALEQRPKQNDFDLVRFVPESLPGVNPADVDLSISLFGRTFSHRVYINAMTGGSEKADRVNQKLASLAASCGLPMALGSVSAAIKNPSLAPGYQRVRTVVQEGFLMANVGLSQTIEGARKAVELLSADALQIHLNAAQEIVMPEGDVDFDRWEERLKAIVSGIPVPVIVKETGFGMSRKTIQRLMDLGVKTIDLSGKGGTNFIDIENRRRTHPMTAFEDYGFSTVESLLEAKGLDVTIFASGGIRGAYDVVKALALGAQMVGLSGFFLRLVEESSLEEAEQATKQLLYDVKKIVAILNAKNVDELRKVDIILDPTLRSFQAQRMTDSPRP